MNQSNKCREQLAEMFLHCLEEEKLPWHAVWDTSPQQNAISGKAYHGINAFTLTLAAWTRGCEDPRWCTFEQGKKAGWHLKKGSKGVPIEFWSLMHRKTHQVVDFKTAQEAIQKGEAVRDDYRYYCRVYHVFNGGDFEGIPEYRPESRGKPDLDQIRSHRDTLLRNMKVNFQGDGSDCHYSPRTDTITMPPESAFHDTYGYVCSFLHEAGHATGHESRLNRPMGSTKEEYAIEELRAEIASAMTAQQLGIPLTAQQRQEQMDLHKAYVQSWVAAIRNAPQELFKAIQDAGKITDYLMEKGEYLSAAPEQRAAEGKPQNAPAPEERVFSIQRRLDNSVIVELDGKQHLLEGRTYHVDFRDMADDFLSSFVSQNLSSLEEKDALPHPVGRIDYLALSGQVQESVEYVDPLKFVADVKEENFYGVPMVLVLYRDKDGQTISRDFIRDLDPPPKGFRIEDYTGLPREEKQAVHRWTKVPSGPSKHEKAENQPKQEAPKAAVADQTAPQRSSGPSHSRGKGGNGQVAQAIKQHFDVLEYAQEVYGLHFKERYGEYQCIEHDSLWIDPVKNLWNRYSRQVGGSVIDLVMHMDGLSKTEAISRLRKEMGKHSVYRPSKYTPLASVQSQKRQQEFVLPESAKPAQRVFQYLEKSRRIHPKVISEMLNANLLYQEAAHSNCVFASPDYDGVIKNCSTRASNDTRFFKESGEKLGWMVNPHQRALFVCEAPIDAMSIMSLLQYGGKDFMDYSYYAQCGMPRKGSLGYHLEHNPEVQTIYLCYDNDEAGRVFTERAKKELQEAGFTGKLVVKSPVAKDFNDDLKALLAHRQPVQPPAEMEGTLCMKP